MTCCVWSPINVYPGAGAPKGRPCLVPRPYSDPCHLRARSSEPPSHLSCGGTSSRNGQHLVRSITELDTAATSRHLIHLMGSFHHPGRMLSFWLGQPRGPVRKLPSSSCAPLNSANLILVIPAPDRGKREGSPLHQVGVEDAFPQVAWISLGTQALRSADSNLSLWVGPDPEGLSVEASRGSMTWTLYLQRRWKEERQSHRLTRLNIVSQWSTVLSLCAHATSPLVDQAPSSPWDGDLALPWLFPQAPC